MATVPPGKIRIRGLRKEEGVEKRTFLLSKEAVQDFGFLQHLFQGFVLFCFCLFFQKRRSTKNQGGKKRKSFSLSSLTSPPISNRRNRRSGPS